MEKLDIKIENLPEELRLAIPVLGIQEEGVQVVLAGGAVRSIFDATSVIDLDFFIIGIYSEAFKTSLIAQFDLLGERVFSCPEGLLFTWKTKILGKCQLITPRFYPTIEGLLNSFDFTAAQFAFDGRDIFVYSDKCIEHAIKRELHIHTVQYPVATMNRIWKYKSHGYKVHFATEEFCRYINNEEFATSEWRHYID